MSIINSSSPSNINHPPLAHDAQGCKVAVPNGTTHWRVQRFTGGRPKTLPGRFELELTAEQLLEMFGPGRYRIEALDEYGKPLSEVATINIGMPNDGASAEPIANQNVRPLPATSDTRFLVETIAQMSRAHSESLQSLANAQADWIKTLANAKQIPRNASPIAPQLPSGSPPESEEPEPWWVHLLKPSTMLGLNGLVRNLGSVFGFKPDVPEPAKHRNASGLAQIAERVASVKEHDPEPPKLDQRAIEEAFIRARETLRAEGRLPPEYDTDSTEKPS